MKKTHIKFLIFGTSGVGKSRLLRSLKATYNNVSVHRKDTTRRPRKNRKDDGLDTRFKERLNKHDYDVVYHKYGNSYGVRKDQLFKALKNKEIHFIIISDIASIKKLKRLYPGTKAIYVHADENQVAQRLKKRNSGDFRERIKKVKSNFKDFADNNTLFDYMVMNIGSINSGTRQLKNIIKHAYSQ